MAKAKTSQRFYLHFTWILQKTIDKAAILHQKMVHGDKSIHNLERYANSGFTMQNRC